MFLIEHSFLSADFSQKFDSADKPQTKCPVMDGDMNKLTIRIIKASESITATSDVPENLKNILKSILKKIRLPEYFWKKLEKIK